MYYQTILDCVSVFQITLSTHRRRIFIIIINDTIATNGRHNNNKLHLKRFNVIWYTNPSMSFVIVDRLTSDRGWEVSGQDGERVVELW